MKYLYNFTITSEEWRIQGWAKKKKIQVSKYKYLHENKYLLSEDDSFWTKKKKQKKQGGKKKRQITSPLIPSKSWPKMPTKRHSETQEKEREERNDANKWDRWREKHEARWKEFVVDDDDVTRLHFRRRSSLRDD